MLKGFRDFILRGNVVDLAVGIVIGAAFSTLVNSFTTSFLKPVIKLVDSSGGVNAGGWEISKDNFIDWAGFVNAVITFLLTAAVLYFLVVFPMNKLAERRRRGESPPPSAPSEEIRLLTEIRDALAGGARVPAQSGGPADRPGPDHPPAEHRP
ncbi:large conductance mechanosensitive channel protein MscL [Plantactinospora sp. CA-290183]|uniref:large conductance mechanosensitive channel protein MscL n=1 Tax=Plantactinospora sp. CA-290183 TaxID=3240006 RepID=UPI003D946E60